MKDSKKVVRYGYSKFIISTIVDDNFFTGVNPKAIVNL